MFAAPLHRRLVRVIPYLLDQTLRLLCISPCDLVRLLFKSGVYYLSEEKTATLGTAEQEESGPFTDIDDNKDEIAENEIVLEDC